MINWFSLQSQPEDIFSQSLIDNQLTKANAFLDLASDDPTFENLEVQWFEYNEKTGTIREKYLFPFYDVVTTSNEYIYSFDERKNITRKVKIYRTEPITKQGKNYVQLFGATNDTTITIYQYNQNNQLLTESEFAPGGVDTTKILYKYQDGVLINSIHYSSVTKGTLGSENHFVEYFYDHLGRLSEERKTPETLNLYSTTQYQYLGETKLLSEKTTSNDFAWQLIFDMGKKRTEVSQDSLNGEKVKYEYDDNLNLTKQTFFRSLSDLSTNFHGREYKYENNLMIEEQSFNTSDEVINLTDKIQYVYDSRGLLIEKKMIFSGILRYTYKYNYE
ncbi:MAG: hypothetical protein AAF502_07185 [Bacteroidota bacterium]